MSDTVDLAGSFAERLAGAAIGRRRLIGGIAAASAVAAIGMPALAAGDAGLRTFYGDYAIHGGDVLSGYFAAPRGRTGLDVVVVLGEADTTPAAAQATARRYAQAGQMAIAPDLARTFAGKGLSREAMVAALVATAPNLKHLPQGSGAVRIVAA